MKYLKTDKTLLHPGYYQVCLDNLIFSLQENGQHGSGK
jgi:hypothetical protein